MRPGMKQLLRTFAHYALRHVRQWDTRTKKKHARLL